MRIAIVACVLGVVGCGKKDDVVKKDDKPAGAPSPAMPAPPPSAGDVHMSCDKLVPKAIVDKYLGGLERDAKEKQLGEHLRCQFKRKEPLTVVSVSFDCKEGVYNAMAASIDMMTDPKSKVPAKKVEGVGKGAVSLDAGNVNFWATNAHCMVNVMAIGESPLAKDPLPLAKDLDAALTPAALQ